MNNRKVKIGTWVIAIMRKNRLSFLAVSRVEELILSWIAHGIMMAISKIKPMK